MRSTQDIATAVYILKAQPKDESDAFLEDKEEQSGAEIKVDSDDEILISSPFALNPSKHLPILSPIAHSSVLRHILSSSTIAMKTPSTQVKKSSTNQLFRQGKLYDHCSHGNLSNMQ